MRFAAADDRLIGLKAKEKGNAFHVALEFVLGREGEYWNDPIGGPTYRGVRQKTYREFTNDPSATIDKMTPGQLVNIYHDNYWMPSGASRMPGWIALMVFDYAVHSGPGRALRELQGLLSVSRDGIFGPITNQAIWDVNMHTNATIRMLLAKAYYLERCQFLSGLAVADAEHRKNYRGYMNRMEALFEEVMELMS